MPTARLRLISVLLVTAVAATLGLVPSTPALADPNIDDVQKRVDTLYHEAEEAQERYHDVKLELDELRKDLASLEADESRQEKALDQVRTDLKESILRQYTGGELGAVGQVLTSGDTAGLVSDLSTMSVYNELQDGLYADYEAELEALDLRRGATEKRLARVAELEDKLAAEQKVVDDKLAEAKAQLGRLKEEERREMLSRSTDGSRLPSDVPAAGRAKAVVAYAMAQVGKSYVYGAAGPSAFDCSGLTMRAWAQAGVGLPHSSRAQSGMGRRVSSDQLQPGDLVFYYSPISHVGIYIGNGLIVHAANPGSGVRVAGVFSMPYSGATRVG